jgi:hypothetical protein
MDCDCNYTELTADQMKLKARILASVSANQKARSEGEAAARKGMKIDANPYNERDDTHWQWLDAWATWKEKSRRQNVAPLAPAPELP